MIEDLKLNRRRFLLSAAVLGAVTAMAKAQARVPQATPAIDGLIGRMTVKEKAGQLHLEIGLSPLIGIPDFSKNNPFEPAADQEAARAVYEAQLQRLRAGGVGFLSTPPDFDATMLAQKISVTETRLRIPLMFGADTIHGFKTIFPVPLAEAASFEPELARRTARAAAIEVTATGHDITYAPMVDIARDQRWGRVVEGAGEDVLLGARFAEARVRGFQGDRLGAADSLLACPKHFLAYGAAESGRDYAGAAISDRVLHEVYLPPFEAAFRAGAIMTMASFNTIDGVPVTGNGKLLTDLLRGQLNFKGAVISDFESEKQLVNHGQATDDREAALIALQAGCDIGMQSGIFPRYIPELVQSGALDLATLDRALRRVLYVKQQAGLFDDPFRRISRKRYDAPVPKAHEILALEAATKSIVLLKNESGLLPLSRTGQRLALIGPFATDELNIDGAWSPFSPSRTSTSLARGISAAMANSSDLAVLAGSGIEQPVAGGIEAAVAAAKAADVVLLAIGESTKMSGESSSRTDIVIPAPQQALAEAVAATGKPLVVILRNGRALALEGAVRDAPAILVTWFLGTESGTAIADILFGKASPSGRLPVSFPLASGQEPFYYAQESSGRPGKPGEARLFTSTFRGLPNDALYPFGHGLSYAPIAYSATRCSAAQIAQDGEITILCDIHNNGTRAVEEVAQLYVHDVAAYVVQPVRKLVDFQKVQLSPGETRTLSFTLKTDQLSHLDRELNRVAPAGDFQVWVAPSSAAGEAAEFTVATAGAKSGG